MMRAIATAFVLHLSLLACASKLAAEGVSSVPPLPESTVGLPVQIDGIVLPGTELEAAPWDDKTPMVVRIEAVYPHGSAFRYDLSYQGLDPGEHDLRKYLRRKDSSSVDDLPSLPVTIKSLLPQGHVTPHDPPFARLPWLGGYRILLAVGSLLWIVGLYWILRPQRSAVVANAATTQPLTLADRLRPLIGRAVVGELSGPQLAELERALVSYWRRRRALDKIPAAEAMHRLREDAEAGPLVNQLEQWLHRPEGASDVDVAALLAPYRDIRADEFELAPALAEASA